MRPHANAIVALLLPMLACGTDPVSEALTDAGLGGAPDAPLGTAGPDAGMHPSWGDSGSDPIGTGSGGPLLPDPMATCDVGIAWENRQMAQWMEPTFFEVSPNGGLLWAGHHDLWMATLTRARDGEVVATTGSRSATALDRAWSRRVVLGGDGHLEVATTVTDQTLAVLEELPENWRHRWLAADISPDGRRVAAAGCTEGGFRLQVWDIEPELRVLGVHEEPYEGEFCQTYDSRPKVVLGDDAVFFSPPASGDFGRWEWTTGEIRRATGSASPATTDAWPMRAEVAAIALSPDGTRVAVTGADARLRLFSTVDLALLHQVDGVRPNLLNEMTYAPPVTASPIAWSPSGGLIATLGPESNIVLRDGRDGALVAQLPTRETEPDETWGVHDAIAGLGFSRDGDALYALQMFGHTAFTCDGTPPRVVPTDDPLEATIDGPERVSVGDTATFTATHLGHVSVHAHRFYLDGEPVGNGDFERTADVYAREPGDHEITVFIDDGVRLAEASMRFSIE